MTSEPMVRVCFSLDASMPARLRALAQRLGRRAGSTNVSALARMAIDDLLRRYEREPEQGVEAQS